MRHPRGFRRGHVLSNHDPAHCLDYRDALCQWPPKLLSEVQHDVHRQAVGLSREDDDWLTCLVLDVTGPAKTSCKAKAIALDPIQPESDKPSMVWRKWDSLIGDKTWVAGSSSASWW